MLLLMKVEVYLKQGSDYSYGLYDGKGILIYSGSYISNRAMSSTFKQAEIRKEMISRYTQERNGKLFLLQDVEFSSPSAAAGFCTGTSSNGLLLWKTEDGQTLSNYLRHLNDD